MAEQNSVCLEFSSRFLRSKLGMKKYQILKGNLSAPNFLLPIPTTHHPRRKEKHPPMPWAWVLQAPESLASGEPNGIGPT